VDLRDVLAEELRRADSLHQIGDRLIDQVRRLLAIDSPGNAQTHIEFHYAPPVPTLAEVTGAAAVNAPPTMTVDGSLSAARELLAARLATSVPTNPPGAGTSLTSVAAALQNAPGAQGEDVVAARLAILLAVIAEGAELAGQPGSVDALHLLSNDLWNTSRTLSARPNPAIQVLDAAKLPRSKVWTGGAFDGRPPALKPGEGVGSGLPGGLPIIDPAKILRG